MGGIRNQNKVYNQSVGNDDKLWGSSPITVEEDFLEEDDWGDEAFDSEWQEQDSIRKVAFQTMEISGMGFYNYDYIIEDVNFISIAADFKINQKEITSTIYIIYDDINSVFYYPKYTWEKGFKIIKNKSYKLFSIDEKGKISILESKPNLNEIANKSYTFNLSEEQKAPQTKEELASLLKL